MTDSEREELLGYLLGALEEDELPSVESRMSHDPEFRRESVALQRQLDDLSALRVEYSPPPGLAERTCRFVASHRSTPSSIAPSKTLRPQVAPPSWISRMSKLDFFMAATVLLLAGLLIVPAIQNSRFSMRRAACQDNLRAIGQALNQYSQTHDGYFPVVPTHGKLAAAGIYAPVLYQNKLINDPSRFLCPDSSLAAKRNNFHIPTYSELELTPPEKLVDLRPTLGGSYGYNLGYMHNGVYCPTKNLYRDNFAVLSDAPSAGHDHQSRNHGARGQNVLYENGNVRFLTSSKPNDSIDDIFTNDAGEVAAGLRQSDAVIGPSNATPIIYVSR
ncbi:MAG: hypothetical protein ACWGMZ_00200 [Thermoguttaceae bacterium]